jgi:AraC-like DNA-binding protein
VPAKTPPGRRTRATSASSRFCLDVGYRQPSAFVELFRQTLGMTPRTWIAALEAQDERTRPKLREVQGSRYAELRIGKMLVRESR